MSQQTINKKEEELEKKLLEIEQSREDDKYKNLAQSLNLPFSDLKAVPINTEALLLLTKEASQSSKLAVISRSGIKIAVVATDPNLPETKKTMDSLTAQGFKLTIIIVTPKTLSEVWKRYETATTKELFEVGSVDIKESELNQFQDQIQSVADLRNKVTQISATKLLEILIAGALKIGASDIHFEPEKSNTRLRYRLDGILSDIVALDSAPYEKIISRVKIVSGLKLNIHNSPQDGRFTIHQQDVDIEVRVSILPSEFGETIVMRLLDPRTIKEGLDELGIREDLLTVIKEQLNKPTGAILTTGPTGSGKTTTLYAFIRHLNSSETKIITIEDPIEYHIEGISQTQVDVAREYNFANGLRAIVRQDPDIILVGEIRDAETADIALQAALTGHLVLSTIHTNDSAGTIPRLIDLGIKPPIIAPAINMAMAQRLVRKLCPNCKTKGSLPPESLKKLKEAMEPLKNRFKFPAINDSLQIYFPGKCKECNDLGYKGRVGVYEAFIVSDAIEKLILKSPAISEIKELVASEGMVSMLQDAYLKMLDGITSAEEIERIIG